MVVVEVETLMIVQHQDHPILMVDQVVVVELVMATLVVLVDHMVMLVVMLHHQRFLEKLMLVVVVADLVVQEVMVRIMLGEMVEMELHQFLHMVPQIQ
jgi:hypothetical protein